MISKIFKKLFPCRFNEPKCGRLGCKCGKGGTTIQAPAPAPVPNQAQIAKENVAAQIESAPKAAQVSFDILNNPEFGARATTRLFEDIRSDLFPEESAVREQLLSNVLQNLVSPTGVSPEQQQAVDATRQEQVDRGLRDIQTSSNLGGGLFGGQREQREDRFLDLARRGFATEDVSREEAARLNAQQAAIPVLQLLFPDLQLQSPQFLNPVPSPNVAFQTTGSINQSNAANAAAAQRAQAQQNAALQSALFQSLGQGVGSGIGAYAAFA